MMLAVLVQTTKCKLSEHAEVRAGIAIQTGVAAIGARSPAAVEPVHMPHPPGKKSAPNRSEELRPAHCLGPLVGSDWQLCNFGEIQISAFAERNLRFAGKGSGRHSPAGWSVCGASYAARSIARMAVSGWLIGSMPTRLTIPVTVPSASASTQAARC